MKKLLLTLLRNKILTVLRGPLRGTKLKLTNLVKARTYIQAYEPDKQKAFDFFLKSGDCFFDIGSNIGLHSYYVARRFPNVKIVAFEPLPTNGNYIRETIINNRYTSISVLDVAVSSANGVAYFKESNNNSTGNLSDKPTELEVKTITLDSFTEKSQIYPDLIKIDVEGAESLVLEGAEVMIRKKRPALIIELHNPEQDLKVASLLTKLDYSIFRLNQDPSSKRSELLIKVKKPNASWPDPDGVWGSIAAFHRDLIY